MRVWWAGNRLRAEASGGVADDLTVTEAHAVAAEAHQRLLHDVPKLLEATTTSVPAARQGATSTVA